MTACGRIVVTAGPTISAADIRSVVPDAEVAPPIAFGQALSYDLRSGDTLLMSTDCSFSSRRFDIRSF